MTVLSTAPQTPLQQPIASSPPPSMTMTYVAVVLACMLMAVVLAVGVSLLRPGYDNTVLLGAIFAGLPPTMLAGLAFIRGQQTAATVATIDPKLDLVHKTVNSGFTEFGDLIRKEAFEAGQRDAEAKQREAQADDARVSALVERSIAAALAAHGVSVAQPASAAVPVAAPPTAVEQGVDVKHLQAPAVDQIAQATAPAIVDAVVQSLPDALPAAPEKGAQP